jgi:hypothetical protein
MPGLRLAKNHRTENAPLLPLRKNYDVSGNESNMEWGSGKNWSVTEKAQSRPKMAISGYSRDAAAFPLH